MFKLPVHNFVFVVKRSVTATNCRAVDGVLISRALS